MPDYVQLAEKAVKAHTSQLTSISNQLWDFAEIRFQEWRSAHLLCEELENEGFTVESEDGDSDFYLTGEDQNDDDEFLTDSEDNFDSDEDFE